MDPLFVNESARDYHLQTGSPCIGAGTPAGTNMGALGVPTAVTRVTWSQVKALFAQSK